MQDVSSEEVLYENLKNTIKGLSLSFIGPSLLKEIESIHKMETRSAETTNMRCDVINEHLNNAKLYFGQNMISKQNLVIDIKQAIKCYSESKREKYINLFNIK